ncbi:AAA family ATPase [Leptolyngbya sp. NK1-12]|uniref:gluconokinase n=1 Tax=Leptolyngbya sp. NK1-12 TaxID=2547451 RepID=A0AA97AQE0_9CYAN|nr:AAA family ATPase [Leptolyngbya sp. NK1-12]
MTDATLPPLIQQMLQPDFYPHPVTSQPAPIASANVEYPEEFYPSPAAAVQLIQTHISYVLLTGEFAYKVKKPLNFGFLDYSTLEARKHFSEEELRLNQRGAAEIYLEVVPITQTGDRYQLGGEGDIVEYAVKMRQFPQDTLLTNLFERGELTPDLIQQLARVIAEFHRKTTTNDYIRSFGEVSQVRQAFDENFEQTAQYIGGPQTQQQFDETKAYCDRFFAEQEPLFKQRIAADRIRECHGDLHLRNICYWNGKLLLFDCIEFNEPFRFVDTMYDIAYIVMDLEARNRPDLSTLFLNTYAEETGDWEGLQVLPIYISRQTYVRAKVTSFLLNDPGVPHHEKQVAHDTAALYYRLAWQYSQSRQGRLILMCGLSGSGKSTTARQVADKLGAIHVRSDAVRKHLGGVPLYERGGNELYTPEMTQKTYEKLLELGTALAQQGYTVILDAKYDRQALRQAVIQQATTAQLPLQIIHCDAPRELLQQRLQHRTGDIADATVDLLAKQYLEPFDDSEQVYVKTIDTSTSVEQQLANAL